MSLLDMICGHLASRKPHACRSMSKRKLCELSNLPIPPAGAELVPFYTILQSPAVDLRLNDDFRGIFEFIPLTLQEGHLERHRSHQNVHFQQGHPFPYSPVTQYCCHYPTFHFRLTLTQLSQLHASKLWILLQLERCSSRQEEYHAY
uniref:Uncharacterized protein n=1 Tax=Arundo donax TaxID=35708 RepID=A0A0A9D5M6_ARUDO